MILLALAHAPLAERAVLQPLYAWIAVIGRPCWIHALPYEVENDPTPGLNAGTGSESTLLRRREKVLDETQVKRPVDSGVTSSSSSVPRFVSWPPLMYCEVKPVDGAIAACRSRSVMTL